VISSSQNFLFIYAIDIASGGIIHTKFHEDPYKRPKEIEGDTHMNTHTHTEQAHLISVILLLKNKTNMPKIISAFNKLKSGLERREYGREDPSS
jgi:hypothetical protein